MDSTQLTTILALGILFGMFAKASVESLSFHINKIKDHRDNNKRFKAKELQVEMMKTNGDFHEWKQLPTGDDRTLMVCAKTGWCPSLNGFLPMENINRVLADLQAKEDYKVFRDERVKTLADEYKWTIVQMEMLVSAVFDIKKQFHLKRLQDLADSMKKRTADVEGNQIN